MVVVLAVVPELRVLVPAVLELRVAVLEPVLRVAELEAALRVLELLLVTVDLEPLGETVLILVLLDPVFATRLRVVVEAVLRAVEVSVPVLRLVVVPVAVVAAVRVVVPEAALRVLVVVVRTFASLSSRTTLAFITLVEGEDTEVFTTRCARSALRTVNERSG